MAELEIIGANKHNLKNVSLRLPKRRLITFTGLSGSGKSSLAYDTIFQEGQRKYLESLSVYARQFLKTLENPEVELIRGISPTISIDQKHSSHFYNSTVGTLSEVSQYLRLMYAKVGVPFCPQCGRGIQRFSREGIMAHLFDRLRGRVVHILSPVVRRRKGTYKMLFDRYLKRGFLKVRIDGRLHYLDDPPALARHAVHDIELHVDTLAVKEDARGQLAESLALAAAEGNGELLIQEEDGSEHFFSDRLFCARCNLAIREPQPATFSFTSPLGSCPACTGLGLIEGGDPCTECSGSGLNREARSFRFRERTIAELGDLEIGALLERLSKVELAAEEQSILAQVFPHIVQRLESFVRLNLDYLTLNRRVHTLSGGELQRTRLVSQIGFGLSGIIYILDEPSIGMHMAEQKNLIAILQELKKRDNTIIVVEHDETTIRASDYIVDLGPGAGEKGGRVVYAGWFRDFSRAKKSLTADYLFGRKRVERVKGHPVDRTRRLRISGISINNIKKADLELPLKCLTVVTGVSGSGKSSLVVDALYSVLRARLAEGDGQERRGRTPLWTSDEGLEQIERVLMVDQTAIGKNSRSCPATYVGLMPMIRELFAELPESKMRMYSQSRFSFNVKGGRCEACSGLGTRKLEMGFLPELEVTCPVCEGRRYNSETLRVKYRGLSIADVLDLTATEAHAFFRNIPPLAKKIRLLLEVGLGYLRLGQSSVTLSGGESQRIKLCKELSRISGKTTLYVLDEPTVGLHFDDIQKLITVFHSLILKGSTIVVIEHNPEVIRAADHVVDLGPGGGIRGGRILFSGPLTGLAACRRSVTARHLRGKIDDAV